MDSFISNNLKTNLGKGILLGSYWLVAKINKCFNPVEKTDNSLLVNHIQYIIDKANTRKIRIKGGFKIASSKSSIKNGTLFINIILEYQKIIKKIIHFIGITKPFVDKFTNWLDNTKNYSGKQLEILKTVYIDVERNEIDITPCFKKIQHLRETYNNRYIQTLSFDKM